jgi:hypothetical protein
MSLLIIVFALIVSSFSLGLFLLRHRQKREKEKTARLLKRFSRLGSAYGLSFTSQEVLHGCVIGLDGLGRKLLLLKDGKRGRFISQVVWLDKVQRCTTERVYAKSPAAGVKGAAAGVFLEQVVLQLECSNELRPVEIVFYDCRHDAPVELPLLNRKAKDWEIILSKMAKNRMSNTS